MTGTRTAPVLDPALEHLGDAFDRLLDTPGDRVRRLRYARTTVAFSVPGGRGALILDLDGGVTVGAGDPGDCEISLQFTPGQAAAYARGHLPLSVAVATGAVSADGPVRKLLEVDPILRALLGDSAGDGPASEIDCAPRGSLQATADLDSELLAVESRGLHKSFGRNRILAGVDLQIPEGVISVVLGPSGTGKSVLLQHIVGLLKPDAGEVYVRSRPLSSMTTPELLALRLEIGVMYQDGALFSTMNVFDNVAFPLRQHTDLTDAEVREVVLDQLAEVGLAGATDRMPGELSGGMRKRAGLARALVRDPRLLICDEPDSGLDPVRTALLAELLVDQHARIGGTMLVITHNMRLARHVAEHISVLWQGQILASGFAEDIFESDDPFIRQFVSGATAGPLGMD